MCWRWERAKGTDLPDGARKQLQKCPITLVLEGEQASFCLWSSVSSSFMVWSGRLEEKSWVVVWTLLSGDSSDRSHCVLDLPLTTTVVVQPEL